MSHENLMRELADGITKHLSLNDIRILIASGADVNGIVVHGLRPLHYAVYENDYECTRLLIVKGCDLNACDDVGYTAVHLCAERGYTDLLHLLIKNGATVNHLPEQHSKVSACHLKQFLKNDPKSSTPQQDTNFEGEIDTSDYEEEGEGGEVGGEDEIGGGGVAREIEPGEVGTDEPLRLAIRNDHFETAEFLLKSGACPNQRYFMGSEINLIDPVKDIQFLKLLLTFGANPNVKDRSGLTPLMRACKLKDSLPAIKILLKHGADVNARTPAKLDFKTPAHYAVLGGGISTIKHLVESGAKLNLGPRYPWATPLDYAILKNDPCLVECLMELGADPNRFSPFIGTPLHVACSNELGRQDAIIEILLKYGADPNLQCYTRDGQYIWTPLVEYITVNQNKTLRFVQLLLTYGAQAVFRLPYLDHRGLLKCLHKLNQDPSIFTLILENGQNFDVESIGSRRLMKPEHKKQLMDKAIIPLSLKECAKMKVRQVLALKVPTKIDPMPIPTTLKLYLKCLEYEY